MVLFIFCHTFGEAWGCLLWNNVQEAPFRHRKFIWPWLYSRYVSAMFGDCLLWGCSHSSTWVWCWPLADLWLMRHTPNLVPKPQAVSDMSLWNLSLQSLIEDLVCSGQGGIWHSWRREWIWTCSRQHRVVSVSWDQGGFITNKHALSAANLCSIPVSHIFPWDARSAESKVIKTQNKPDWLFPHPLLLLTMYWWNQSIGGITLWIRHLEKLSFSLLWGGVEACGNTISELRVTPGNSQRIMWCQGSNPRLL